MYEYALEYWGPNGMSVIIPQFKVNTFLHGGFKMSLEIYLRNVCAVKLMDL